MPVYHSFVEQTITRISLAMRLRTLPQLPMTGGTLSSTPETSILWRLEILHCRVEKIMTVSMAVTATHQSHNITKMSYLAFVFVPLNFWAAFFSMSKKILVRTYWIYGAFSVPT